MDNPQTPKLQQATSYNLHRPVTDWCGRTLHHSIRRHVGVGNIVRIGIAPIDDSSWYQTVYFRIIKHCGGNKFRGVVEDGYYGDEDWFLVKNGDTRVFRSSDIDEIPLTWPGNKNLRKYVKFV